jgi:hypothetical protein
MKIRIKAVKLERAVKIDGLFHKNRGQREWNLKKER